MGRDNIYENVIEANKLYNVRPLAFFTDAYVFSWFWDNMYALLLIILIMHVFNLFFIYKICEKIDVKLNAFSLILFAFAPMLVEALYWISASTRIVFSLFLCLASIYLLLQSFEEENKAFKLIKFFASIFLNLICVGYYEQTIALNLFLYIFVMVYLKKYRYIFIPILSTTWIGAWYLYFMANGQMQARGALDLSGILNSLRECITMINTNFETGYNNFLASLNLGTEAILSSVVSIILFALVAYTIFYIYKEKCLLSYENKKVFRKLFLGALIFVAPFLPFLILSSSYIAMRNMYLPFLGFVIILECVFDLVLKIFKNEKGRNAVKTAVLRIFDDFVCDSKC